MNKHSVICAVDVNDFDQQLVDLAASFANALNTELEILHITVVPEIEETIQSTHYSNAINEIFPNNERLLEIHPDCPVKQVNHHHLLGMPAEKLLQTVQQYHPQLLVLGTHARSGLKRLLLGSVAEHLMRNADCPVLVLRLQVSSRDQQLQAQTEKLI